MRKQYSNKGVAKQRRPSRSAIPVVRQAFDILDALNLPYEAIPLNRDCITRWRSGYRGPQLMQFMEMAEALDCDIVLVPRQQGRTPAAPQPADSTPSGEGTAPATAGPVGLAA